MKSQMLYRGGDNKKVKPIKMDKAYDHAQKLKRKAAAAAARKSTAA